MAQTIINVGASPNDGTGDPLRTAFQTTNANFTDLYTNPPSGSGSSDTQVLFNDAGAVAGDAGLVYNKTTDALTVAGGLAVGGISALRGNSYVIGSTGISTWAVDSGTAMTLNAIGLLVGTVSDLTGANISSSRGLGTANTETSRFATVEYGSGANGEKTIIIISFAVTNTLSSVIIEALLSGYSGVYLDHVAGRYSDLPGVVIRNNASAGTTVAALAVDGTGLIYTLTITTVVTHPVIKVKVTSGGLGSSITLPIITFA